MSRKVLVFDYDGTIVDSYQAYAQRFDSLMGAYGLRNKVRDFRTLYLSNFSHSLLALGLDKKQILALIEDIRLPFVGKPRMIPPFQGMVALLCSLTARYEVYIVTSNITSAIQESLDCWGITGIKKVIGGDVELSKVTKLERIRKKHPHAALYYIGDTVGDITEAKEAGYRSVGVAWGYHSARVLEQAHPDFLVMKPSELGNLFA